jgi:crossover junction endodeoxyribonuclease RuvC
MVTPQKWKKAYPGLDSDKDKSRMMATRIWPEISTRFKRKKDDGRAEALLIAKWGKDNERV